MSGEELKAKISTLGISVNELGRRLEMSSSLISQALQAKDIKTGLLERICIVLNLNMSFFYPEIAEVRYEQVSNNDNRDVSAQNIGTLGTGNGTVNTGTDNELVSRLLEELSELRKTNQKLTDSNQKLMEKLLG